MAIIKRDKAEKLQAQPQKPRQSLPASSVKGGVVSPPQGRGASEDQWDSSPETELENLNIHLSGSGKLGEDALGTGISDEGTSPAQPPVSWSEEAVLEGVLPNRRIIDREQDRRQGYRRIEDRQLISKAYEEAAIIREDAKRQGHEEGLQQAMAELDHLRETIFGLANLKEEGLMKAADDIASIALTVSERILRTEVSCDPTLVLSVVKDTIEKVGKSQKSITIRVHPEDAALVRSSIEPDGLVVKHDTEVMVREDTSIDMGSCMVETGSGLIDASFKTQLSIIRYLFGLSSK